MTRKNLNIFLIEDNPEALTLLKERLSGFKGYEYNLYIVPCDFSLYDVLRFGPDVIVKDIENPEIYSIVDGYAQKQNMYCLPLSA